MVTPVAKRQAVRHIQEALALSERRACALVGVARRVARYISTGADDAALRQRLRELADQRRRFGYRRLGYLLAREGFSPNHKKLFRLYQEEGLKVRHRGGRKRALGTRSPMTIPQEPGRRWSLDFCLGCPDLWPPVPHSGCYRRFQSQEPGIGCRHVIIRWTCGAGTDSPGGTIWQTPHDCQRQRYGVHIPCHPEMGR